MGNVLIFGATGSIGRALCARFSHSNDCVHAVVRHETYTKIEGVTHSIYWNVIEKQPSALQGKKFDAVVWAQGENLNDSILNFDYSHYQKIMHANVDYILQSLSVLLSHDNLAQASRLCIVSSIWQHHARQNKLSYTISKSALQGLVLSLAVDLGPKHHLVNAVLPGAIDTPMTRENLTPEQIKIIQNATPTQQLTPLNDIAECVYFLCSLQNQNITGQFLTIDGGFSFAKIL
jgi:3-oxoacyl-[acyl-carrier protein] reductase